MEVWTAFEKGLATGKRLDHARIRGYNA